MAKVDFRLLSNVQCQHYGDNGRCRKRLKQNLVNKIPEADRCYTHFIEDKYPQ